MRNVWIGSLLVLTATPAVADVPVSLRGSPASMVRQNQVAHDLGLPFARTPAHLRELESRGELVRLEGNANYGFREGMRSGVARPEMRTFIERLSSQYRAACGERLIVTSLTRAMSSQPSNSHPLSVHPAGMAVDLRISQRAACRQWLERTLLSLEAEGVLDVTRESRPPHYHIALFPAQYLAYLERILPPIEELQLAAAPDPLDELASLGMSVAVSQFGSAAGSAAAEPDASRRAKPWHYLLAAPLVALGLGLLRKRITSRDAA